MGKITIKYDDVFMRCKFISSYEAQQAKGAAGNSIYTNIVLTDADKQLVSVWLEQGMKMIEAKLSSALNVETEYTSKTEDGKQIQVVEVEVTKDLEVAGASQSGGSFRKSVEEALVTFCLQKWMEDKIPTRGEGYARMFDQMCDAVMKIAFKRKRPTMEE